MKEKKVDFEDKISAFLKKIEKVNQVKPDKKKQTDEKLVITGVYGADIPADWDDDDDDMGIWEPVPRDAAADAQRERELNAIFEVARMKEIAETGVEQGKIVDIGLSAVYGTENDKAGDVFLPRKTDVGDVIEVAAHYGQWGSAISDQNGRLYATAAEIVRAWGVDGWEKVMDSKKTSAEFLMDLRDWFLVKYMPMLNACATIAMYAEFKGVGYSAMTSRVHYQTRKLERDGDDMTVEYWGGVGGTRKTRRRQDPMQFVTICGVRHILVPVDEIEDWYMFLARKGMGTLVTEARFGEARYLGNMLVAAGKMTEQQVAEVLSEKDSVERWLDFEGMVTKGRDRAIGDNRKWGGYGRQQCYTDEAWEDYSVWAKTRGMAVFPFVKFVKRVYALGYTRFAKGGRRGFYWWDA